MSSNGSEEESDQESGSESECVVKVVAYRNLTASLNRRAVGVAAAENTVTEENEVDTSAVDLRKAVKNYRRQISNLNESVRVLSARNDALKAQVNFLELQQPNYRGEGIHNALPVVEEHAREISLLANKFAIMTCPWLSDTFFIGLRGRPDVEISGSFRYRSSRARYLAFTAEVYDAVPVNLHSVMEGEAMFAEIFKSCVSNTRSRATLTARRVAPLLFDMDPTYFRKDTKGKDVAILKELLGWDEITQRYTLWSAILYPSGLSGDQRYVFRNPALPKILRVIFFGPSSVSGKRSLTRSPNALLWKVNSVTDGAIAFAAITAKYLFSPDGEFTDKVGISGIDYADEFWRFRQLLASVGPEHRKDLFDWYNRIVFGDMAEVVDRSDDIDNFNDALLVPNLVIDNGSESNVFEDLSETNTDHQSVTFRYNIEFTDPVLDYDIRTDKRDTNQDIGRVDVGNNSVDSLDEAAAFPPKQPNSKKKDGVTNATAANGGKEQITSSGTRNLSRRENGGLVIQSDSDARVL